MQARILFLTDLHKRDTDFTTIQGYTNAVDAVQDDILAFVARNNVTHIVIGGDWYDKGYRNINRTFNDLNYDKAISDSVNGNVFLCRGNHLYLERDSNPEMYVIQPCEAMPLLHNIKEQSVPIFQSPDIVQIGPIQISLFHFDKQNKFYHANRDPSTTFHIGVYHDDTVLPSSIRSQSGDHGLTSSATLNSTFDNIDLAICNHIHTAIGQLSIPLVDKKVPMFIPGSLCITKNQPSEIHSEVHLPVVTLNDDNSVKVSLATFSVHMELLKLYKKKETEALDADRAATASATVNKHMAEVLGTSSSMSLKEALIKRGYTADHIAMIDEAASGELNTGSALVYSGRINNS